MKKLIALFTMVLTALACSGASEDTRVILGDERSDVYMSMLEGKRVAIFSNMSGIVGDVVVDAENGVFGPHLLDLLMEKGMDVKAIFSPEHGFRGDADAGEHVNSSTDPKTGVPILSLYGGKGYSPSDEAMDSFDVLVVDIQDVGLRYYTYYITMYNLMTACAEKGKEVVLLDRPNPNGFYVDGPILDTENYSSGIGRLPIPIVHGMTLGELAQMINGEGWIPGGLKCDLKVVPCLNYGHQTRYDLIMPPSPNLKDMRAIYLYASTCFFEGTEVSLGRGTDHPFEMYGHPDMKGSGFSFTPRSMPGAKSPVCMDQECHGRDLRDMPYEEIWANGINLEYIIDAYHDLNSESFFLKNGFFNLLTGVSWVREMIEAGNTADEIKARWQDDVTAFKAQRKPYLLYAE